jgi:hypothetical protein
VRERVDLDSARFAAGFVRRFAERLPLFLFPAVARVPRLAAVIFLAVLAADLPRDFCAALALLTSIPSVEPMLSATLTINPSSFAGDFSSSVTEAPSSKMMGRPQQTFAAASAETKALRQVRASSVKSLNWPASLNDANQHHDDRENEQDMDEPAQGIGRDHPQQPQNYQDYRYCPKQVHLLLLQKYSRRPLRGASRMEAQYGQFLSGAIR